ncbi:MAG: DegV family protein [Anaerolineae bacterium]|nr:DegV family protein [Anaerolineae bacterium]MDW8102911.1 DegV family protein [Anaerolineae bacterium]
MRIAIVTDSSANLPEELVREYDIKVVPIYLLWNGVTYRDGVDISSRELYRRLKESSTLPKTSAPSVGDFLRTYLSLASEAEVIISIHLPPNLSATYGAAQTAAQMVEGAKVYVANAHTAAAGQGLVVLEAARLTRRGAEPEVILKRVEEIGLKTHVFAFLSTLKYLYFGGRIGLASALLGSALQFCPILYIKDGVVDAWSKPRTRARALQELLKIAEQKIGRSRVHMAVMHGDALEDALYLKEELEKRFDCAELFVTEFTPVMGAHTGPGLVGIAFWCEE